MGVRRIVERFAIFGDYKQPAVHYIWDDLWWKRNAGQTARLEKLIRVQGEEKEWEAPGGLVTNPPHYWQVET